MLFVTSLNAPTTTNFKKLLILQNSLSKVKTCKSIKNFWINTDSFKLKFSFIYSSNKNEYNQIQYI